MNVAVDGDVIRREMERRGLSARALAREAKLAVSTVSIAMAGGPIAVTSLKIILDTIHRVPIVEGIDEVLRLAKRQAPRGEQTSFDF